MMLDIKYIFIIYTGKQLKLISENLEKEEQRKILKYSFQRTIEARFCDKS